MLFENRCVIKNIVILYFAICNFDFRKVLIIYVRLWCFYSTDVLSGKRYFRSNEILTACLNLRTGDLRDVLEELKSLRQKIQLPEELDIEFDENYDHYVQQAQNLLFKIDDLRSGFRCTGMTTALMRRSSWIA